MILQPLSKSHWQTFLKCPWKAHCHKNLRIPSLTSRAGEIGREAHALIDAVLKGSLSFSEIGQVADDPEVVSLAQNAFSFPDPQTEDGKPTQLFTEQYVMLDDQGKKTDMKAKAILHGYLDVLWRASATVAHFRDWKSGRWEQWDEFENFDYALMAKSFFPGVETVISELCFLRSGNVLRAEYHWEDNDTFCLVTKPDGSQEQLWSDIDPLLEYFLVRIDTVLTTEPLPRPGKHCSNWYGTPCQFFGKECPLNAAKTLDNSVPELIKTNFGKALAEIIKGDNLTKQLASDGYYGIQQLKSILNQAEKRIEEWSKNNGPIVVGETKYGWKSRTNAKVDVPYVLETLINSGIPIEEWSPIFSVSKSSIKRLSKRSYGDIREQLEAFAITEKRGEPKFQALNNNEEEGEN
jgi:hypothetical protein